MFEGPFSRESLSHASSLMLIVLVPMAVYVYVRVFRFFRIGTSFLIGRPALRPYTQ